MPLQSYEIKEHSGGAVYAVITLADGSTFGQYIRAGTQDEMDAQVLEQVTRMERAAAPVQAPAIGTVRRAADMPKERA